MRAILAVAMACAWAIPAFGVSDSRPASPANVPDVVALSADPHLLLLKSGVFDPQLQRLDFSAIGASAIADTRYALVQFKPGTAARVRLQKLGVQIVGFIPNAAYQVRLDGVDIAALRADPTVRWVGAIDAGMKLDPALWNGSAQRHALVADASTLLIVHGFAGESAPAIAAALKKSVTDVVIVLVDARADAPRVRASVPVAELPQLITAATALDGVSWVEPYRQPRVLNDGSPGPMQGNAATCTTPIPGQMPFPCASTPLWDRGLVGNGQILGIADSGLDHNEAWFSAYTPLGSSTANIAITPADSPAPTPPAIGMTYPQNKVYAYWVQPGATAYDNNSVCPGGGSNSFHGTHTSGTLVGDAAGTFGATTYLAATATNPNHDHGDGMAPNAQILFQDIGNDNSGCLSITDLRATLDQAFAGGARIHSDSWGDSTSSGSYEDFDADVDAQMWKLQDMLIAIAAGNEGASGTDSPGNAKNALTVGALGHANNMVVASFSSRGPTADGRLKPDIMAPGTAIVSAAGDTNNSTTIEAPQTKALSGTSMATPTIAGNAALMREYFSDGFYPRGGAGTADTLNQSGMLMKAVLLNGTYPLPSYAWPGSDVGWGRMWLASNLYFNSPQPGNGATSVRRMRYWERPNAAGMMTGDVHTYTLQNVQAGQELRVTLAWYDPAGALGAAKALVNNLDLQVDIPGGTTYLGNVFKNGVSIAGGTADSTNNVEQVRIVAPVVGLYTLRVIANAVPGNGESGSDAQGYALVASGAFGLPDRAALAAPTDAAVTGNGVNGIVIGFTPDPAAQGYQLYRTDGTCGNARQGDFRMVATGAGGSLTDTHTQGGYAYAYEVRGVNNDVEGDHSTCVDATSNAACTLPPSFDQTSVIANAAGASCGVNLSWAAATSNCPAASAIHYQIARDTHPYFTTPTILDGNATTTSYTDSVVANGQPYYYQIMAFDAAGNAGATPRTLNATPAGAPGASGENYLDNVDTHAYFVSTSPWQITNTAASDGSYSYHSAADNQPYPSNTCAAITSPPLTLSAHPRLSYMAQYNLETQYDGVVVEISSDGGTTWNDLPPTGGYPNTFALTGSPPVNACGYAASHGAFSGKSTASWLTAANDDVNPLAFHAFASDLSTYAGQTVQIRFRLSSDPATAFEGFFLDQVQVNDADDIFGDGFEPSANICQ